MFQIIDDSTDEEKYEAKDDSVEFSVDCKAKEVGQEDEKLIDHSNDHVYHLDDFTDDEHILDQQPTFMSQDKKFGLIDEDSDGGMHHKKNVSGDGVFVNNNALHDEPKESLQGTHVSDEDEEDSFIDDESLGYYSTDDEHNDDD